MTRKEEILKVAEAYVISLTTLICSQVTTLSDYNKLLSY